MKGTPLCIAGCGRPVKRSDAHCFECRKTLRAARARAKRGAGILPAASGKTVEEVAKHIRNARENLDRMEAARERAEREGGLDAMPFGEVDLWTRSIRAELTAMTETLGEWSRTARDIENHVGKEIRQPKTDPE
jgi:transposase